MWEVGMSKITGGTLKAADFIQVMKQKFSPKEILRQGHLMRKINHALMLMSTIYHRETLNVCAMCYYVWIRDCKATNWEKNLVIKNLQEQIRLKNLEIEDNTKSRNNLGWFNKVFQDKKYEEEHEDLTQQLVLLQEELEQEIQKHQKYCFEVYWKPFYTMKWLKTISQSRDLQNTIDIKLKHEQQKAIEKEQQRLTKENSQRKKK